MSANVSVFRAGGPAGRARSLYPDAPAQLRLAFVVAVNLAAVASCFPIENLLLPWHSRMDSTTAGWCFLLAQAGVLGFAAALIIRGGSTAVIQTLLTATLLGYAYMLAGKWLIDPRRTIQSAHLVFRAVQLGLVSVAAMALGVSVRLMLRQRLVLTDAAERRCGAAPQYHLGELMFLVVVFAVGMGLVNLFFDHVDRETQLGEVLLAVTRSLPAALPWLWGVMQRRLTWPMLALIVASSLALMVLKAAIAYAFTGDDFNILLEQAGRRAVAYAASATLNGLLLRGLGFHWSRG
jgi:hypothetical protein